jgi:hypothetical protein
MKIKELVEDSMGIASGGFASVSVPFVRMHRKRKSRAMRKESGQELVRRQPYANIAEQKDKK